ncbi:hypothetical protein [Streptomyces sp. SID8499]|uniref:hypothetical protein n=1 Tax=Streptomyces sp. SID8499 TaxID=2706106 RepID=UPI0013C86D39|nr:hypothetical protein [Streptomyces sp. SID8499]NED31021.1 hypothetical protein [Streptomyces sp. SID8499]
MSDRLSPEREAEIAAVVAVYAAHPDLGFACCSAHPVADAVPALLAELAAVRAERDQARELEAERHARNEALPDADAEREKLLRWHREDHEQITKLVAQRDRRRARLVALQNDALSMRGSLSPNGGKRAVPFPLGETLTPAVDWLIAHVAELEARLAEYERPVDEDPIAYTLTETAETEAGEVR